MLLDVHTHHTDRSNAIINASISDFKPLQERFYSVGIHPWDIKDIDCETALKSLYELTSSNTQIIAIGECGLDALIDTPESTQTSIFEKQIILSEELKKPLIIHCVKRYNEILCLHRKYKPQQAWILHGFRSNSNVLRPILEHPGIYISIGEKFNPEAVKQIPTDRLLIETDESILPIEEIAMHIATTRGEYTENLIKSKHQNLSQIFTSQSPFRHPRCKHLEADLE